MKTNHQSWLKSLGTEGLVPVFVYGSLLRGETNEFYSPVTLRLPAVLDENAILYSFGFYPALVLEKDFLSDTKPEEAKKIRGELLIVRESQIPEYDRLEGHDPNNTDRQLYQRSEVKVLTSHGSVSAYVYHMTEKRARWYNGTKLNIDDWRYRDVRAN